MRAVFAALLLISTTALAQPTPPSPVAAAPTLDWFNGEWAGTGTMFGQPSKVALTIAPALGGSGTALAYRAEIPVKDQPPRRFEARATYRIMPKGRVEGQWSDSNGSFHRVGGRISGSSMTTLWGDPATEIGRSTYERDASGALIVTDSVLAADGSWRVFAQATYRRE